MPGLVADRWTGPWLAPTGRYMTAIASTAVVIWVRWLLQPWLNEECPFSLFYLSVLLTAWIAGTGPAILAVVMGTFAAAHFFIPPESSLLIDDVPATVQLIMYVFVNCIAIYLFDRAERQRGLAEKRAIENERLSDDLRLADLRKDEFLAILAHELRNPLAPIRSSLALLERKGSSTEVVRQTRDVIHRQTMHLIRITDDLLDVSRFCRGKVELQICRMDLRVAISDALEMVEGTFVSKAQRFHSLIPDYPIWVNGDRVRLAQLTANLLGNASKYTPSFGRITLSLELIDEWISIIVRDNGIGFAPEQSERILEPFVQIDTSRTREYGGLGVGLTIVNRLVALHGGDVLASSRGPGMGSCFTVRLPAIAATSDETALPNSETVLTSTAKPLLAIDSDAVSTEAHGKTILLVEDNPDASAILSELLQSEGFRTHVACDGVEAVQKAMQHLPDIIIMDIGLPCMDGYEAARRLRRSPATANAKLLALTGWGAAADRDMAAAAGFDMHLIKPIAFHELLEHVNHFANQSCEEAVLRA